MSKVSRSSQLAEGCRPEIEGTMSVSEASAFRRRRALVYIDRKW